MKKYCRYNYLILIYLSSLLFFLLFRVAETVVYCSMAEAPDNMASLYPHALWNGFRFDTAVSCYFLTPALLMLIVGQFAKIRKKAYYAIAHYLTMVLYTIGFLASAADIPFFCYFSQRLDATVLTMGDSLSVVVDMIVSEPSYIVYFFVFLAVSAGWWLLCRLVYRRVLLPGLEVAQDGIGWNIAVALLFVFGLFTGMRGHLSSKRPLRPEYAVFCSEPFLNQIGLNPVFTFIKSAQAISADKRHPLQLTDAETAKLALFQQQQWPMAENDAVSLPKGTNVVIVLMESMSVEHTALGSNPQQSKAPCLDSIMHESITFTEAWSAGTQSYNGIYSTHYGHPTIFKRHSLNQSVIPRMCGLPHILRSEGYSTAYFMPHKGFFDGMEPFLYSNGYDRVFEESSYPPEELVGTYGVPDHILFRHAINYMNEASKTGPFYVTVATCSNHGPYVMPQNIDFTPHTTDIEDQIVEYSDWSIGQFISEASKQPWFSNTLFVFVADHGCVDKKPIYDIPLARVRIPISFYAPERITPKTISRLALQIDVAPTILGMLGIDYDNRMLGIDVLRQQRLMGVLGTWETIGATDGELLYIYRKNDQSTSLYNYRQRDNTDISAQYPEKKKALERYALGMVQLSYQMLTDGTTDCSKPLQ